MKGKIKLLLTLCILIASTIAFAQSDTPDSRTESQGGTSRRNTQFVLPTAPTAAALFEEVQQNLIPQLSDKDQQYYAAFARQIKLDADGLPDVSDPNTIKAYLAFYKLRKYGYHKEPLKGRITEDFALLGYSSVEFRELHNSPHYLALRWLEKTAYTDIRFKLIPLSLQDEAQTIALDLLYNTLQERFKMHPTQIKKLLEGMESLNDFPPGVHHICDTDNEFNDWNIEIDLHYPGILSDTTFYPFGLVALHEFLHAQDTFPGSPEDYTIPLVELSTSLQDIMLSDLIYKQLNNIPLEETVEYDTGDTLPVGEIAVFLHQLQQEYPNKNMTQLLLLPQLQEYIQELYEKYNS